MVLPFRMRTLGPGFLKASGALRRSRSRAGRSIRDEAFCTKLVVTLCYVLAQKVWRNSIRVNAVAPGPFWMPCKSPAANPRTSYPNSAQIPYRQGPVSRQNSHRFMCLLAFDESSYSTGRVFGSVGGRSRRVSSRPAVRPASYSDFCAAGVAPSRCPAAS